MSVLTQSAEAVTSPAKRSLESVCGRVGKEADVRQEQVQKKTKIMLVAIVDKHQKTKQMILKTNGVRSSRSLMGNSLTGATMHWKAGSVVGLMNLAS